MFIGPCVLRRLQLQPGDLELKCDEDGNFKTRQCPQPFNGSNSGSGFGSGPGFGSGSGSGSGSGGLGGLGGLGGGGGGSGGGSGGGGGGGGGGGATALDCFCVNSLNGTMINGTERTYQPGEPELYDHCVYLGDKYLPAIIIIFKCTLSFHSF